MQAAKHNRAGQGGAMAPYLTLALLLVAAIAPQAARADLSGKPAASNPAFSAGQVLSAVAQTAALHSQAKLTPAAAQRLLSALAGVEIPAALPADGALYIPPVIKLAHVRRSAPGLEGGCGWPGAAPRAP